MTISIKSEIYKNVKPKVFRDGGRRHYKVKVFLSPTGTTNLTNVHSVRYNLHESFKDPTRTSYDKARDFAIDIWTYGYFGITADIRLDDGTDQVVQGKVTFNVADAPTEVDNPFERLRSAKQKLQSLES